MTGKFLVSEAVPGKAIRAGQDRIIPVIRSFRVRFPGFRGVLGWDRPEALLVVSPDGDEQVVPIKDVTRRIQIALLCMGVFGSWMIWRNLRKRRMA